MLDTQIVPLFTAEQISQRISALGAEIRRDFPTEPLMLIAVLKGAAPFLADLLRALPGEVTYDFLAVSSYGSETKTTGIVRILKDIDTQIEGKHVIIVEDIVDTGLTLAYLLETLNVRHPAHLKVCCLLDKPARRQKEVPIDYRGFEIDDRFVVGYGLDWDEKYRNLPFIAELKQPAW
jgi:hypoxanthine phosphoribosyltransferase